MRKIQRDPDLPRVVRPPSCRGLLRRRHDESGLVGQHDRPGKPVDTDKFFVVGVNNLGGCHGSTGPSSIDPQTGQPYGANFPVITVEDWVHRRRASPTCSASAVCAVIAAALAGCRRCNGRCPIQTGCAIAVHRRAPHLTAQNIAFNDVARSAIITIRISTAAIFTGTTLCRRAV